MTTSAGALAARLTADTSQFRAEMGAAANVSEKEMRRIQKQVQFVNDYIRELGKAQREASNSSAGLEQTAKSMEHVGFASAGAKRELLVLAHELSQGNYSRFGGSLLVLAERTNAAELAFSAAGAAIGVTTAIVGGFVLAVALGAHEQDVFEKSLIATGNAAGLTADGMNSLVVASARAAQATQTAARSAAQAVVSSGAFGPNLVGLATQAVVEMERVTGEKTADVVKEFAKMQDGVAKWAAEHVKRYHDISGAQYIYIKQLEEQGRVEEAQRVALKASVDQNKQVIENLGYLASAWEKVKGWASEAWEAMKGVGKAETAQETLGRLRKTLEDRLARGPLNDLTRPQFERGNDALRQDIQFAAERARFESQAATQKALNAAQDEAIVKAADYIDKLHEETKGQARVNEEIAKYQRMVAALKGTAKEVSPAQQVTDQAAIRKKFSDQKSPLDAHTYDALIADIAKYDQETQELLGHTSKLTDYERFSAEMKARLSKETEKLTAKQREWVSGLVDAAAAERRVAEETRRATEMEQEMQKLLSSKGLVPGSKESFDEAYQRNATKYIEDVTDQSKRAESVVKGSFSRMEDAIVNFAKTGKLSFSDLFGFMAEEFLRNQIRMAEKQFFTDAAGNYTGLFTGLGNIGSAISGFFSHADGMSYVPYDGYRATLHEGERVVTKAENMRGGGGGSSITVDASIGQVGSNVSRADVAAALAQQARRFEMRIARLQTLGRLA